MNKHTALTKDIERYINSKGIGYVWQNNTGAYKVGDRFIRFGHKGSGDLLGVIFGKGVALECKTGSGKQTPDQKAFEKKFSQYGGVYAVIRSMQDLEDLVGELYDQTVIAS